MTYLSSVELSLAYRIHLSISSTNMNEDQRGKVNAAPGGSHHHEEQRREEPSAAKRQRILPQTLLTGKAEEEVLMPFVLPPRTRLYIAETPEQCVEIGKKMLSVCKGGTSAWGA